MTFSWMIQPPDFLRRLFPQSVWRMPAPPDGPKTVYLTFDDGPVPEQTPWVLDLLAGHGIKATFFCVGDNVRKHPVLFQRLIDEGHQVGNHTFNHLQLLRNNTEFYLDNIAQCSQIEQGRAQLFRPPHGQMTPWTARRLLRRFGFRHMVFWDVMPADYDAGLTPQQVLHNVLRFVRPGSVIVFHDSVKAGPRMRFALQETIRILGGQGYSFGLV